MKSKKLPRLMRELAVDQFEYRLPQRHKARKEIMINQKPLGDLSAFVYSWDTFIKIDTLSGSFKNLLRKSCLLMWSSH